MFSIYQMIGILKFTGTLPPFWRKYDGVALMGWEVSGNPTGHMMDGIPDVPPQNRDGPRDVTSAPDGGYLNCCQMSETIRIAIRSRTR